MKTDLTEKHLQNMSHVPLLLLLDQQADNNVLIGESPIILSKSIRSSTLSSDKRKKPGKKERKDSEWISDAKQKNSN